MSNETKTPPTGGVDFIRRLVGAWDCCGTCAGSVLAEHDRAVHDEAAREVLGVADRLALNSDLRNGAALARALRNVIVLRAAAPTDA